MGIFDKITKKESNDYLQKLADEDAVKQKEHLEKVINKQKSIIEMALETPEGKTALAQAMVEPLKVSMNYQALGQKLLKVDELPEGVKLKYDYNTNLIVPKVKAVELEPEKPQDPKELTLGWKFYEYVGGAYFDSALNEIMGGEKSFINSPANPDCVITTTEEKVEIRIIKPFDMFWGYMECDL